MKAFLRAFFLPAILFLLLQTSAAASNPGRPVPRVVLLHSLSAGDYWTRQTTEGVVAALSEKADRAEIFIEFLDAAGQPGRLGGENFKNLMEAKYGLLPPDLVIASGMEAFNFAAGIGNRVFKGAPLVFYGLERERYQKLVMNLPATGIFSPSPHAFLLSAIGRLHPGLPVFFITEPSTSGMMNLSRFSEGASELKEEIRLAVARDYSPGALSDVIKALPSEGAIVLSSLSYGAKEGGGTAEDGLTFISQNSSLPVYTLDESGVSKGAAGNLRWNGFKIGKRAGEMASELLSGKPMAEIAPEFSVTFAMALDYRQMKRLGIPRDRFPDGTILINDPLETAGRFLPAALVYAGALLVLFALAFFLRGRINSRKRAEKELRKITDNWKTLFQYSPEGIVIYDESGAILETNKTFRSIFAFSEKELENAKIQTLLPWSRGTLRPGDFFPEDKTGVREAVIADRDGAPVHGTHLSFQIEEGRRKIYCSLIEDISERKKIGELLRHKSRYQQSLSSIAIRFLLGPDYGEAMESSLKEILKVSGARAGAVFRYSGESRLLVPEAEASEQPEEPFLTRLFPSSPEETIMWESSVLRDGGVRPVTFTIESGVLNFRNPWRRLAANGVSSVFVMPLAGMEDTPGILVLADPDKNWKYEGLEADFQFLRNTLTAAMEHHLDEISLENNRRVAGDRFAGVITALCQVSELKDMSTSGHQRKVSALAEKIAVRLGLPGETALAVRYAGLAHDIGKLYIPAEILSKPSDLTPTEYELVKKHPEYGRDILSPLNFPWPLADIILQHHERIDGSGYPAGLKKDEICIEARILAAADSFDAMTSERPYREKMPTSRAMAEIRLLAGRAYDPDVAAALEALVAEDLDGSEK